MYIYIYACWREGLEVKLSKSGNTSSGGFLSHGGSQTHHGCFNTISWSSMTWMIWGYHHVRTPFFYIYIYIIYIIQYGYDLFI